MSICFRLLEVVSRTVSVQSVAAVLVLPAFSGSYITALATVAWQVQHAAVVIFASAVAADGAHVSVLNLCF